MRAWLSLPLILALVACPKQAPEPAAEATEQAAAPSGDAPLPVDPGVRSGVLDNGMRYFIEVNQVPEKRAVFRLAVDAGSVLEDDDQRGIAHFLEHMAFNGSEHFEGNELIAYLESVGTRFGAHLNAHTSVDETVYKLQVPTDDSEILDTAFVVFEDWAGGLTLSEEEIEKERGVVLEEWRSRRGAGARIGDAMRPLTWHDSPYVDRKTIGTEESLKTFTPDAVRRFYADWYRPDLMTLIVVGDIDPDAVEAKIVEHFSDLEMPAEPRERVRPEVPAHEETFVSVLTDPELGRTSVGITHKHDDVEQATYGAYRTMLVDRLVAGMVNQRFADMAQEPDAPFLGAFTRSGKMTPIEGSTSVGAATTEDGALDGLRAIGTEIARVRQHGFLESELERAKQDELRGYKDYYAERDTTHSRTHAEELVRVALTGESVPGIEKEWELAQRFLGEISLDDVNERARAWWMADDSRVVAVMMPEKEGLTPPTEDEVRAVLAEVAEAEVEPFVDDTPDGPLMTSEPTPGEVVEKVEKPELGAEVWTLSNGVTVWVKPTDFKADEVLVRSHSPGGHASVPEEGYVPASTASGITGQSGVGNWRSVELSRFLSGRQASIRPWIGDHHEGMTGSASPDDLELLFQLLHLGFTEPRFDADALEVFERAWTERLRNRDSNPSTAYSDRFNELMWQGHPRHQPWTLETLEELDLEASEAFYADRFADASDFTFTIVGNVDLEALEPLVATYLGSLPTVDRTDEPGDDGARRAEGVHEDTVKAGVEPKARLGMEMHGDFEGAWQERAQLFALREVLSVMLRRELREELGGVYGVGVSARTWELPEPGYRLSVSFQCDPERVDELEKATRAVLEKVKAEGVDPSDVADTKAKAVRGHEEDLEKNSFWVGGIDGALRRGEDPMDLLGWDARQANVTPESVNAAAKTYIDLDQYVRVVLLPEDEQE